jgi:hypothetical protein
MIDIIKGNSNYGVKLFYWLCLFFYTGITSYIKKRHSKVIPNIV